MAGINIVLLAITLHVKGLKQSNQRQRLAKQALFFFLSLGSNGQNKMK